MFQGIVVHGEAIGRTLGFPTANIDIPVQKTKLKDGVYASIVTHQGIQYVGALAIKKADNRVEVFLVDYDGPEFYCEIISVEPLAIVSEYEQYASVEELKKKIAHDVSLVILTCQEFGYDVCIAE
jgi:riboflavin kinase/FMN adenylyltransferase